jgi:predicted DNA-binding transcriptional regulator YafY
VAKGTAWYLVARAPNGLRTYRVSRIEESAILDEPFARPPGFDLAAYWKATTEAFSSASRYPTRLRLEPAAAASLRHWCRILPDESSAEPDADGRVTFIVDFDGESHAVFVVPGLGSRVEVIEPPALRERVSAEVVAMFQAVTGRAGA